MYVKVAFLKFAASINSFMLLIASLANSVSIMFSMLTIQGWP
jgi:hypothetical protein